MIDTKDLSESQKIPPTMSLLFKAFNISISNLKEVFSVDDLVWNPNCSITNILPVPVAAWPRL
jgi:hypothetical protein